MKSNAIWVFVVIGVSLLVWTGRGLSQTANQVVKLRSDATLTPYTGSGTNSYQWQFNSQDIQGATNASLSLHDLRFTNEGLYTLAVSNSTGISNINVNLAVTPIVIWGDNQWGQTNLPSGLSNIVAITAGGTFIAALRDNGSVVVWGDNTYGQTNVPPDLTNAVAIAAGESYLVALRKDGTVIAWGQNDVGETNVPPGLSNVVAIACGLYHNLALKTDGSVVGWGFDTIGEANVPPGLNAVIAIGCGGQDSFAVRSDGTAVQWGDSFCGEGNMPTGLSGVAELMGGSTFSIALTENGGLVSWGCDYDGGGWVPGGLGPVCAIDTDGSHTIALLQDGTVNAWGYNYLQHFWSVPASITNAIAVAAGDHNHLALVNEGEPIVVRSPRSKIAFTNSSINLSVAAVGAAPLSIQWRKNGSPIFAATNSVLAITNVLSENEAMYDVVVSNALGWATSAKAFLQVVDTGDVLNSPSLTWTNGGDLGWLPTTSGSHDGSIAFQTGALGNSQKSVLGTTVSGPGTLNFWWKASIVNFCSSFWFQFDTAGQIALTSQADWQPVTFYVPAGTHSLQWTFYMLCGGTGWLDEVSYVPGPTLPTITSPPGDRSISAGLKTTFQVAGYGTPPLRYQWRFNGADIAGATNASLQITNVQEANGGVYTVAISNDFGFSATNSTLTVIPSLTIKTNPLSQRIVRHSIAGFSVTTAGSEPFSYQWQQNGANIIGATNAGLKIEDCQISQSGTYRVIVSNAFGIVPSSNAVLEVSPSIIVAWGDGNFGLTNVPSGLTNVVAIAAGLNHNVALTSEMEVRAWGDRTFGQTNVPVGLNQVTAISAGTFYSLALKSDGSIVGWGDNSYGQSHAPNNGLTNVQAIAAGYHHSTVLLSNGTILSWGDNSLGQTSSPAGLTDVVAIAAGDYHNLALKRNGTVVAWGAGTNLSSIPNLGQSMVPGGLSNVTAIAAGKFHSIALRSDGKVIAWGDNSYHQTNVPTSLNSVVAIAAGQYHTLALRSDGTIVAWGAGTNVAGIPNLGQSYVPPPYTNGTVLAGGGLHSLALINDGAPQIVRQPVSQTISAGMDSAFDVVAVGNQPLSYTWKYNDFNLIGSTNSTLMFTNVPLSRSGYYQCVVSNALDTAESSLALLQVTRGNPGFDSAYPSSLTDQGFKFRLTNLSGHGDVIIYGSSNLLDWAPILTNPPALGSIELIDTGASNFPARLYRVEEQ